MVAKYARVPPRYKGQGQAERVRRNLVALHLTSSDTIVLTGSGTEDVVNNATLVTGDLAVKKKIGNDVAVNLTTGVISGLNAGFHRISAFIRYSGETNLGYLSLKVKDTTVVELEMKRDAVVDTSFDCMGASIIADLSGGNVTVVLADAGGGGTLPIDALEICIEELDNVA
jgi:hypothetical protein